MAVTAIPYNSYKVAQLKGHGASVLLDIVNNTIKCALLSATHVPSQTQTYWGDISVNEMTGTAYVAGGQALTGSAVTQDNTNNRGVWTANNVTWANSTIANARYAVLYKDTGVAATSPLIGWIDFGANQSSSGTDFVIQWASTGVLYDA